MSLKLKSRAGLVTFYWEEGPMRASWELTPLMEEGEIVDALLSMLKHIQARPIATVIPLHAVPSLTETPPPVPQPEARPLGWSAAPVQPVPLGQSLSKAEASGFELIPPDEAD